MNNMTNDKFLQTLKKKIKEYGFTQEQIAKEIGIKPPVLSRQLGGKDHLSVARIEQIFDIINISGDDREHLVNLFSAATESERVNPKQEITDMLQIKQTEREDMQLMFLLSYWVEMNDKEKSDLLLYLLKKTIGNKEYQRLMQIRKSINESKE